VNTPLRTKLEPGGRASHWRRLPLGDFLTLKRGYDLPASQRIPGVVPVVSSSGITGQHDTAKVSGPGVVTGRYGTLGQVFFVPNDFWPLNTSLYVRDFKGNDPRFAAYFLRTVLTRPSSDKAAVPGVNRNDLHAQPVRVTLDVDEQKRIARVLSQYDDLIENNRRRICLLERTAQTIYKAWFEHGRIPTGTTPPAIQTLRTAWTPCTVSDVATIARGTSYRTADLNGSPNRPFVNLKCVARNGGFRLDGLKTYSGTYRPDQTVQQGDIIVALTDLTRDRAVVARAARVPPIGSPAVFSMDVLSVTPRRVADRQWLYCLLRYSVFANEVGEQATGTTVLHLRPNRVLEHQFSGPPRSLRERFGAIVSPVRAQQDRLELEKRALSRARDLLLPRLMNGEIKV
jgi:type I restriction enzyme S subunit